MTKSTGKITVRILAALMAGAVLLSAGCLQQNADIPQVSQTDAASPEAYTFTEDYMRVGEPYGSGFIISGKTARTEVKGRTYIFAAAVGEEERAQFISAQEQLCAYLDRNGIATAGLTFYAVADYKNRTESDNAAAFIDLGCCGSWEQVLTTLQASLGDYTNYGYLYALSNRICTELCWTAAEAPAVTASGFTYRAELLNLVYPCFDEFYTSANNIERCKALAVELLEGMDDPFAGEKAFVNAIEEYADAKDIDFTATYLRFAYNGTACPMKMLTERMEVFRQSSYDSGTMHKLGTVEEDPMATVGGLIATYEQLDTQLASIMKWLMLDEAPIIPVELSYPLPNNIAGIYFTDGGLYVPYASGSVIYSSTISVLAHEFTHYLYDLASEETEDSPAGGAADPLYEGWMNEAIAYYCTLENDFEQRLLQAESGTGPTLEFLEEAIGQEYDEPMDEVLLMRVALLEAEHPYPYYLKGTNKACAAFGEYFVRTYGEEAFFSCMLYPSYAEAIIGVTVDQVVDDWCEDMARGLVLEEPDV